MSFAEHGPRIFLAGKFNSDLITKYGEYVLPREKFEGRLKRFDSCLDLRAWSLNALENCRYFRDVVENPWLTGKIVPYEAIIQTLNALGYNTHAELLSLRRQLETYKSLRLTAEQENELRRLDEGSSQPQIKDNIPELPQEITSPEDQSVIPRRPGTPTQFSDEYSEDGTEVPVFSETDSNDDIDSIDNTSRHHRVRGCCQDPALRSDNHQATIIAKDSEIIALKNELGAKDAELDEFREVHETSLNEKNAIINSLQENIEMLREQLNTMGDEMHLITEDYEKKLHTLKCSMENLKCCLEEKSEELQNISRELDEHVKMNQMIRGERESLSRKVEDMKNVIFERNELLQLNRQQALKLADQEDDLKRLFEVMNHMSKENDEQKMKMKNERVKFQSEINRTNIIISKYENELALSRQESSDVASLSEMPTLSIKKMRCKLREDLQDLEDELSKRRGTQENEKEAIDQLNKERMCRDKWERNQVAEKVRREEDSLIDRVLANHTKRSNETTKKLSAALQGAGIDFSREMAIKQNELEARNVEIIQLREQVAYHVSRGQGDQLENVNSDDKDRLKKDLKRLSIENTNNCELLNKTRNELQSCEFKLKGSNQRIKELRSQNKKKEHELKIANEEYNRLLKENECLNKTVLITNDFAMKVDEMEIKLESSQQEIAKLTDELNNANQLCSDYKIELVNWEEKQMKLQEEFGLALKNSENRVLIKDGEIQELIKENDYINKQLQSNNLKIMALSEEVQSLKKYNKQLEMIESSLTEIRNLDEHTKTVYNDVTSRRSELEFHCRRNEKLEKDLMFKLSENETLSNEITEIKKNIERISSETTMPETSARELIITLPRTISDQLEILKTQLKLPELQGSIFQSMIDEWKETSREYAYEIDKLRREVDGKEKKIIGLEEANEELKRNLEEKVSGENYSDTVNTIEQKDEKIRMLLLETETMKIEHNKQMIKIQSLITEKTELYENLQKEKDSRQIVLTGAQQKYKTQLKAMRDEQNDRIKRLEALYEESQKTTGNSFDPETWIQSLNPKELIDLRKRLSILSSCEPTSDGANTRALNDKQNQQLQQELHDDIINLKNGHHKEANTRPPFIYVNRTPNNDFDPKLLKFIDGCAKARKLATGK